MNLDSSAAPNVPMLDDIDRRIIALLQWDARMSNAALAEALGISQSTSLGRVRSLRERRVITGYHADVDRLALGFGLQALIGVRVRPGARQQMASLMDELAEKPHVVQVFFLGGDEDFLVHVAVRDSSHVREFVLDHLSANPAVAGTRTSLVLEHRTPRIMPTR